MKALVNASLFDFERFRPGRYVLFDDRIRAVGPMEAFPGADEVYDCAGGLTLPGLVLGHTHIYSAFSRGWVTPFAPKSFRELLEQLWWKLDAALDLDAVCASGLYAAVRFAQNGVTTAIDHHAGGAVRGSLAALRRAVVEEGGLRGVFCFETSERFPLADCIAENVEFAGQKSSRCAGLFGMHALMTLSDASLARIARESGELPIHIHAAESEEDEQVSLRETGRRIVPRLLDAGLLRPGSILAHGVHLDETELTLLEGQDIYMALNPTSNMNNGVGLPDVRAFAAHGLRCMLGNDGMGFGLARDVQNLAFGLRLREGDPTAVPFGLLARLLRAGYDCAGRQLGCRLGRFEAGYEADMQFLPYIPPTPMDAENIWGHVFYGLFDDFRPRDVWCAGRAVVQDGHSVLDEEAVCARARENAARVWRRIDKGETD